VGKLVDLGDVHDTFLVLSALVQDSRGFPQ